MMLLLRVWHRLLLLLLRARINFLLPLVTYYTASADAFCIEDVAAGKKDVFAVASTSTTVATGRTG